MADALPVTQAERSLLYGVSLGTGILGGLVFGTLAGLAVCVVSRPRRGSKNPRVEDDQDEDDDDERDEDEDDE